MKSFVKRAAACGLALTLGLTSLAGCGKSQKIDGTKTVATVNGEALPLGVASFYAKYQQAYMYQLYMMYFGQASSIFDEVVDEESGKTYAEDMKESVLSDLEKMMVINQHAEEYEVSLTDEQKEQIETAAQAYIDANEQSVLDKIGANKDHIAQLMTLQTIQSLMMDPIVKDVDREVTDEEAQQTTLTYVGVTPSEETESNAESAASAAESTTAESTAAESTAAESTAAESTAAESTAAESTAAESAAAESTAAESTAAESTAAESATSDSVAATSVAAASETVVSEAVVSEAAVSEAAASEAAVSEAAVSEAAVSEAAVSEAAASEAAVSEAATSEASESEAATSEAAAAETETQPAEETEAQKAARADAQAILDAVMAESDIANADMDAIAKTVKDTYNSSTGQFTTTNTTDTYLDANVVSAAAGLADGTLVDHVVVGSDGSYYVVRVDHVFDEDATATKKKDILSERKQTAYDEKTDAWVNEAEITVNDDVWKLVVLSDSDPVTLKAKAAESTAESAASAAESAASTVESAASAAESAVSAVESAAGAAESAASAVESAVSAVESAASTAESAAESAVSAAESAVSEAASAASETASAAGAVSEATAAAAAEAAAAMPSSVS